LILTVTRLRYVERGISQRLSHCCAIKLLHNIIGVTYGVRGVRVPPTFWA